ncbi:MAG: flavin reductase family protein [Acidobacteriota bacterium]|nr:flavin reductase family protein [Acidobacteriota bacterium]
MKQITDRDIAALLNPRPVALITCCDEQGKPNVLTVTWTMPVSHRPPMIAISVGTRRYSHQLIQATGEFVVNIVGQNFQSAIEICGNSSGAVCDKFLRAGLHTVNSRTMRPPRIAGALGYLECCVASSQEVGDHTLFVATVEVAEASEKAFTGVWETYAGDVLLCRQRELFGMCHPSEESLEQRRRAQNFGQRVD